MFSLEIYVSHSVYNVGTIFDRHDITERLLKVALKSINQTKQFNVTYLRGLTNNSPHGSITDIIVGFPDLHSLLIVRNIVLSCYSKLISVICQILIVGVWLFPMRALLLVCVYHGFPS